MNYECTICRAETALTGSCRGCGAPSEVEGRPTRRRGRSQQQRYAELEAENTKLRAALTEALDGWHGWSSTAASVASWLTADGQGPQQQLDRIAALRKLLG